MITRDYAVKDMSESYKIVFMDKGFFINHQRYCGIPLPDDISDFKLFWTSPGSKSYYGNPYLMHKFKITSSMSGIKLTTSPSDLYNELSPIKCYNLSMTSDAFKDMWYGILEDDLLAIDINYINLNDEEIIFSTKSFAHLKRLNMISN